MHQQSNRERTSNKPVLPRDVLDTANGNISYLECPDKDASGVVPDVDRAIVETARGATHALRQMAARSRGPQRVSERS